MLWSEASLVPTSVLAPYDMRYTGYCVLFFLSKNDAVDLHLLYTDFYFRFTAVSDPLGDSTSNHHIHVLNMMKGRLEDACLTSRPDIHILILLNDIDAIRSSGQVHTIDPEFHVVWSHKVIRPNRSPVRMYKALQNATVPLALLLRLS